jgi:predicted glycogen debranching enzyme
LKNPMNQSGYQKLDALPGLRQSEWLEPDGLGGFASGTISGLRTRRYHAILLAAITPPTNRLVLVNGFEAWVERAEGGERIMLTSQQYGPDSIDNAGEKRIESFTSDPWPHWKLTLPGGHALEHEIVVPHGQPAVILAWRMAKAALGLTLCVRPFFSGRDYHALQHENNDFHFEPQPVGQSLEWRPYDNIPAIRVFSNGHYEHEPHWYRNFYYAAERERGLEDQEDLAAPGVFRFNLANEAVLIFSTESAAAFSMQNDQPVEIARRLRYQENLRRTVLGAAPNRTADAYLVARGKGKTVIAGYPWFTDWGRDTFISVRGLCLTTGRWSEKAQILLDWTRHVSEGMLPNRFPDGDAAPEYNSVDASLWFIVAAYELLAISRDSEYELPPPDRARLIGAILAILNGYTRGTRFGIRLDEKDGLLFCGEPGSQLTWMDARVNGRVITPRIGKPVEIQALWLNALSIGAHFDPRWQDIYERGYHYFPRRFWREAEGCLYDVVDCDYRPGAVDPSFRPNQIFAVGGLPIMLLAPERARRVVAAVEEKLWTPMGLRTLAPDDPRYRGQYVGDPLARDEAYHQGTAWPWLAGPFIEAYLRVEGGDALCKARARQKFLEPLEAYMRSVGQGHLPEIADGDAPHTPRGCPFQAWSLGEFLRAGALTE